MSKSFTNQEKKLSKRTDREKKLSKPPRRTLAAAAAPMLKRN
jgi:hypothetical protein